MDVNNIEKYKSKVTKELKENILSFWINNAVDLENGGFFGKITNELAVDKQADKGCILNSRILWTYSCAYRMLKDEIYLKAAERAYEFMITYFWDKEYSGLYWMVDYKGHPVEQKKQIYNIAFGIYSLSEYYLATGNTESLEKAIELYRDIERYSYDIQNKGYLEACTRNWKIAEDMRLSPKDLNSKKSMNTHLHILEAYTNLLRAWNNEELKDKLKELINVTIDYIINDNYQFNLFFDEYWNPLSKVVSYGHDIEGSWLLYEAAEVLGDKELLGRVKLISVKMAEEIYTYGIDREFGGLFNEKKENGEFDEVKAWWPQAEAMVGFLNAYELSGDDSYFDASLSIWKYVDKYFIDKKYGEWFNEVYRNGKVLTHMPKVDPWKCPYHNSRACFEIVARLNKIIILGGNSNG